MTHKVLMPIGDASEVLDTLYPFFRLPEDGFVVVVSGRVRRDSPRPRTWWREH